LREGRESPDEAKLSEEGKPPNEGDEPGEREERVNKRRPLALKRELIAPYRPPDFSLPEYGEAPVARFEPSPRDGVAPRGFHATSNHPEYVKRPDGTWELLKESRMDAVIVDRGADLAVVEARRLKQGELVAVGRTEDGEDGILVHTSGFEPPGLTRAEKFAFRTRGTRESAFSASYESLYDLLRHDRDHGYIVWVAGPAVAFDKDSRESLGALIEAGYCHALLAGNALATHDLEAGYFGTGLGQDVYNQRSVPGGHYHHLDVLNEVRLSGGIAKTLEAWSEDDPGIMRALLNKNVPYVLAGSIRDDGPLPEVIADAYEAQDLMRVHARRATTVIAMATQLHSIAFGNQVPGYRVLEDGSVRPVILVVVDTTEFSADKLANRGSAQARAFLTNVQDFLINLRRNLVAEDP
jgi:hypothetical protein